MKSPQDTIDFINDFYRHVLDRPHMYSRNPQSLEETLMMVDQIREFILSDADDEDAGKGKRYATFLLANGFGASRFTSRHYPSHVVSDHDKRIYQDLCEFWRKYLASREGQAGVD
jgi:hypothetical protein